MEGSSALIPHPPKLISKAPNQMKTQTLLKILALTESSNLNEAQVAHEKLQIYLVRFGLTLDDLLDNAPVRGIYSFSSNLEKRLLFQVYAKVTNRPECSFEKINNKSIAFDLTPEQHNQVEGQYNFYKNTLKEELSVFFSAFIQMNGIYPEPSFEHIAEISEDDRERVTRVAKMGRGMTRHQYKKQLNQA